MIKELTRGAAIKELQEKYGLENWKAKRVLEIAQEFGRKAEPCTGGFVHIVYRGFSSNWPYTEQFTLHNHANLPLKKVASPPGARYTSITFDQYPAIKEKTMPAARTRASTRAVKAVPDPEPETETEAEEPDLSPYLTKNFTPTMLDYIEWADQAIGPLDELASDRLFVLGSQMYPHFQKSELNITRREARKAERAAANGDESEAEEEATQPARARRTAHAKPTLARKVAAEPEPEEEEEEAPARPARRSRSKAKATANAAPY